MIAREYTKRIDIYQYESEPDGFSGNIATPELIASSWAKLVDSNTSLQQRATVLGITDLYEPLIFRLRFRNDLPYNGRNLSLSYNGNTYVIKSISDVNEFHREIEILCTKTIPETVALIPSLQYFDYTLNFTITS